MTPLMIYLLKVNGIFILLYLFYQLMLRRDTFYGAKRTFLMSIILFSVALPLFHVAKLIPQKQTFRYIVIFMNDNIFSASGHQPQALSSDQIINLTIIGGMIITLLVMAFRFVMLLRVIRKCDRATLHGEEVYIPHKEVNPFSFNGRIYLNPALYDADELAKIIEHERAHINQRHGIDLTLLLFFRLFVWMNPVYYWFANAVRENIEFLADQKVLKTGNDPRAYQYALLKVAQSTALPLTQHFNISHLKKRIIMMNKKRTHTAWSGKYLLIAPLLLVAILLVNAAEIKAAWANADFSGEPVTQSGAAAPKDLPKVIIIDKKKAAKEQQVTISVTDTIAAIGHLSGDPQMKPLYIVDNKQVNDLNSVPINQVQSISVLKDESAVKTYGEKGKNGVVVISTKKEGDGGKVIINVNDVKVGEAIVKRNNADTVEVINTEKNIAIRSIALTENSNLKDIHVTSLKIFDRWGKKIFNKENFQFSGNNKNITDLLAKDIPNATYYCIMETTNLQNSEKQIFTSSIKVER